MKLQDILESYDTTVLDQISADKVDEVVNLRLPQPVIIQEIITALTSQSYISGKIQYGRPPTYAILNLILQDPNHVIEVEGFRSKVLSYVEELTSQLRQAKHSKEHSRELYIKILKRAWENDGVIDKSEAHILELVKEELEIYDQEHYSLMHDDSIIKLWDVEQEYFSARNQLLTSGIILIFEKSYVIAEEVATLIRNAFGIQLLNSSAKRLLLGFSKEDLAIALNYLNLNTTGAKEIMIDRLIKSHIPTSELLDLMHLDTLRDLCRSAGIAMGGQKSTVIDNIIYFFDSNQDIDEKPTDEIVLPEPLEPELREIPNETFSKILFALTGQQLYDILYQSALMTSGSKDEKVKRIVESRWSERSLLNHLRKEDLSQLCRRFAMTISGSKQELIDRLMDYNPLPTVVETSSDEIPTVEELADIKLPELAPQVANLPANFEQIAAQFPELQHDEHIILAIIKEAKSVTEQDIERIAVKHKLGWVLHKAHLAELMAKLKRSNQAVLQIKSIQNSNIYQWQGNENDVQNYERRSARDIVDALRHGVVPKANLGMLMVGQQQARLHLSEILLEVNGQKSHFKFIRGQYGSGKTFLCSWLKEFALSNEFAVSYLNISHDQPLSDLPVFFSGMVNSLRTPEKTDSSALVDILESWLLTIQNRTLLVEGLMINMHVTSEINKVVETSIELELANLNDIEPGFSQALRAFYRGKIAGDRELTSNAVAWITGARSLSSQALREIGVKGVLEANNVFPRMRAILEIIRGAKYKGLLLLVDELELVRKFPHARQREQALETLRLLIDEAGKNALPGCFLLFTGTDEFFEDERYGLKSYEALAERVMTPLSHESFVSMRQPIISLESLDRERLSQVVLKIRDLYGEAYHWNAIEFADDETILQLINDWTVFGEDNVDRKPRPILRQFIQMLDICNENKGVRLSEFLKKSDIK